MDAIVDLEAFPLDAAAGDARRDLVARCRRELDGEGLFDLRGLVRPAALAAMLAQVEPLLSHSAFLHRRHHNVYFRPAADCIAEGLPAGHPALAELETTSRTLCGDQLAGGALERLHLWPPLAAFLAEVLQLDALYPMADPLARLNVMGYQAGESLNWHFDRADFSVTLLLQASAGGGLFEYRRDLRRDGEANYDGVARLLAGQDPEVRRRRLAPGTLNLFRGRHSAHRVTPVEGPTPRIVAVLSFSTRPDALFTSQERIGFYGRAA